MFPQAEDKDSSQGKEQEDTAPAGSSSCRQLCMKVLVFVRTPMLRKISLIMYFDWISCSMIYYGLSLNSANFRYVVLEEVRPSS